MDERFWLRFLPVMMSTYNYDLHFRRKGLKVNEGLAICYRKELFRFVFFLKIYGMKGTNLLGGVM